MSQKLIISFRVNQITLAEIADGVKSSTRRRRKPIQSSAGFFDITTH